MKVKAFQFSIGRTIHCCGNCSSSVLSHVSCWREAYIIDFAQVYYLWQKGISTYDVDCRDVRRFICPKSSCLVHYIRSSNKGSKWYTGKHRIHCITLHCSSMCFLSEWINKKFTHFSELWYHWNPSWSILGRSQYWGMSKPCQLQDPVTYYIAY